MDNALHQTQATVKTYKSVFKDSENVAVCHCTACGNFPMFVYSISSIIS